MERAVAYHDATSRPIPHVSFKTSKVIKPHHMMSVTNIRLPHLSNFASLTLIIANTIDDNIDFTSSGYIVELFSIFKNNEVFCIKD